MRKTIAVNFVAKHSYLFVRKMVEGLVANNCNILAIVSKNMPEIDQWRALEGVELYEVDGYSSIKDFPIKLLKLFVVDARKIQKRAKELNVRNVYLPVFTYWSIPINQILRRYPYVYALHDPQIHESKRLVTSTLNSILAQNAKYLVILSESFRNYVSKTYRKDNEYIITIPSGDETENSECVELVQYDSMKVNFLFQGRIDTYKGLDILADAYEKLSKEYSNITLTIAGSGDFSPYMEKYKRLKNCTVINRWLTNEEVNGLFNDVSVITVLPYITATQSGVINVAMPKGSPIIATRCGGIIEQIEDNITGYLVEPNNSEALYHKMKYTIDHKKEWDFIRKNAYARMKTLSWDTLAKPLAEIMGGIV